jgi:hypothetical protein
MRSSAICGCSCRHRFRSLRTTFSLVGREPSEPPSDVGPQHSLVLRKCSAQRCERSEAGLDLVDETP